MYHFSTALRLKKFWLHNEWIGVVCIFIIAACAFTFWTAAPTFVDPDSFYHLKLAELMGKRRGPITNFPWLTYTTLSHAYVDHHLLYHIFLIPFIVLFGSFFGMKMATIILAASTVTLFYILLRSVHVRYAFLFSLLLLCTYGFSFRMGLSKAPSVGFLFLVGGFFFAIHTQYRLLLLLSFFFVWAYGGFILLPIMMGMYSLFAFLEIITKQKKITVTKQQVVTCLAPFLAAFVGTLFGLLIHPSFPQHFLFYWQQIIQIGLVNYQETIGVGGEWYPTALSDLVTSSILLTTLLLISIPLFILTIKKQPIYTQVACMMTIIFFLFTVKSQRYIEYYVPWGFLFSALSLHGSGILYALPKKIMAISRSVQHPLYHVTIVFSIACIGFLVPTIMIKDAKRLSQALQGGIPFERFSAAGMWLREHSTKGDIVLHNDWDEFPILFYRSARNRYIVGLDPTFMYTYDKELYWKWVHITTGEQTEQLFEMIQNDFHARFVFVDRDHTSMYQNLINDGRFIIAYEDSEATIFRVPRTVINK
ncbi:MAG TPA: hypothetical protein VJB65_00520 [Patescibacteria group bacterium]|nr:hypothetical protein [Patescibacteria group bacterium]